MEAEESDWKRQEKMYTKSGFTNMKIRIITQA